MSEPITDNLDLYNDDPTPPSSEQEDFEPGSIPVLSELSNLQSAVLARCVAHLHPVGVAPDLIVLWAEEMVRDIEEGLVKYAKGQLEHGGDFRDCDHLKQAVDEVTDLVNYMRGMRLVRKYIKCGID
jgi:hypothetical protein